MRRGYTLIELIIVSILVAVLATLALPFLSDDGPAKVAAAREKLWHDLLDAQAWSIANPTAPATVTFGDHSYEVQRGDDLEKVSFGRGGFDEADGVTLSATGLTASAITFTHSGAVRGGPDVVPPVITLMSADGRTAVSIEIAPTSGELRAARTSQ
jgi:prepilin-type N-terminal cleavage/methylation domain-containing protein